MWLMNSQNIKALRQQYGLTQEQFARELGVTTKTISEWERQRHKPSSMAKVLIANWMNRKK
jgi:DNA-binding transcriptional regulator YiaG